MRTAGQLLALTAFCLHGSLLAACGEVVTTVGETSELRSEPVGGSFAMSGNGGPAESGSSASGTGASGTSAAMPDGAVPMEIPSADGKCAFQPLNAERRPLEMYILLDSNITLLNGVWDLVVEGLRTFATDPLAAGTYVGLRSFGTQCDASAYQMPDVAVDRLPNHADLIDRKTQPMGWMSSPTLPALRGGIAFEAGRAVSHPDIEHVVILISDGFTGDISLCPPYLPNAVINAARDGFTQSPSIPTYVLVIKNLLDGFTGALNGIDNLAEAGGTGDPITIDQANLTGTTLEALHTVRRRAQPCEFLLPASADPGRIGIALLPAADGGTGEVPRVLAADACGASPGWYFDDPALPASMHLCPASCALLQADNAHRVQPLQGCEPATR
jgi:hypothetical protein